MFEERSRRDSLRRAGSDSCLELKSLKEYIERIRSKKGLSGIGQSVNDLSTILPKDNISDGDSFLDERKKQKEEEISSTANVIIAYALGNGKKLIEEFKGNQSLAEKYSNSTNCRQHTNDLINKLLDKPAYFQKKVLDKIAQALQQNKYDFVSFITNGVRDRCSFLHLFASYGSREVLEYCVELIYINRPEEIDSREFLENLRKELLGENIYTSNDATTVRCLKMLELHFKQSEEASDSSPSNSTTNPPDSGASSSEEFKDTDPASARSWCFML